MYNNVMEQFERTELLLGKEKLDVLSHSHVAVFGLGGVGSYVTEALSRVGVGQLTLVDDDVVSVSNINRQLYALYSTLGQPKALVAQQRIADINPICKVNARVCRFDAGSAATFNFADFNYVVDAIDSVESKLLLISMCRQANVPIISCMGTGNKLDATRFVVADISQTAMCPLARVMRSRLRKMGVTSGVKTLFSTAQPIIPQSDGSGSNVGSVPGSVSFVPSVAGLLIAAEVVKDLIGQLPQDAQK